MLKLIYSPFTNLVFSLFQVSTTWEILNEFDTTQFVVSTKSILYIKYILWTSFLGKFENDKFEGFFFLKLEIIFFSFSFNKQIYFVKLKEKKKSWKVKQIWFIFIFSNLFVIFLFLLLLLRTKFFPSVLKFVFLGEFMGGLLLDFHV